MHNEQRESKTREALRHERYSVILYCTNEHPEVNGISLINEKLALDASFSL